MTRIYSTILIPLPIESVYDYATTPGNWPHWHPSSLAVSGATSHSLEKGEQVIEEYVVAGRRGKVTWTVSERVVPHRWVIEGDIAGSSGHGTITYTCNTRENGTFFEREFIYTPPDLLSKLLDRFLIRPRIESESRQALLNLKAVLLSRTPSSSTTSEA